MQDATKRIAKLNRASQRKQIANKKVKKKSI